MWREVRLSTILSAGAKTESNEMAVTLDNFSSKWGPDVFSLNGKKYLNFVTSR